MGPALTSHSFTPPKEGGSEEGKSWGNQGPQRVHWPWPWGGAGSCTQTSRLCSGMKPAEKGPLWCGLGYCSVQGLCCLVFCFFFFFCCCCWPLSNPNRKPRQWGGIIWKLRALKTLPHSWQVTLTSPWWRQGWSWGQILARSFPWKTQSSCPPRRGRPGSQLSPGVYGSSAHKLWGWRAPSPAPSPSVPIWEMLTVYSF